MPCRRLLLVVCIFMSVVALSTRASPLSAASAPVASKARVQMYRNGLRSLTYVPTWRPGHGTDPTTFQMRAIQQFRLDGDGSVNVHGNVYPLDVDADGKYELVHFNGYRVMRVYRQNGTKLWEHKNSAGRVHRSPYHRDSIAILNADGVEGQEIVRCWAASGSNRKLQVLKGTTGKVLRSVTLSGDPGSGECQIAAVPMTGHNGPVILVARPAPASAGCRQKQIDVWSWVTAYDAQLNHLWTRNTCDAGHYVWPLDADRNGVAEYVFIGKYLYDAKGTRRCTLPNWGQDHIDSMVVSNFRSDLSGHEAVAVGVSGTRAYRASSCTPLWSVATGRIPNPQVVTAARTAETPVYPWIFIQERGASSSTTRRIFRLDAHGRTVGTYSEPREPTRGSYQVVNLDGNLGGEDRMGAYGRVFGNDGAMRLGTGWYATLQNLSSSEQRLAAYNKWTFTPLVFDMTGDARDEMIVWGRNILVIGSRR